MDSPMREVKLCLLGDAGVGKSSLVVRFVQDTFSEHSESTIGASFMSKTMTTTEDNGEEMKIRWMVWDTAGQERYRGLCPMYSRNSDAAIITYDITSRRTFEQLKSWLQQLQQNSPPNVVLAITGNKADLEDEREVSIKEGEDFALEHNAVFMETSAKSSANVNDLFEKISKRLPSEVLAAPKSASIQLASAEETSKKKFFCVI